MSHINFDGLEHIGGLYRLYINAVVHSIRNLGCNVQVLVPIRAPGINSTKTLGNICVSRWSCLPMPSPWGDGLNMCISEETHFSLEHVSYWVTVPLLCTQDFGNLLLCTFAYQSSSSFQRVLPVSLKWDVCAVVSFFRAINYIVFAK